MADIPSGTDFHADEIKLRIGESGYARVDRRWGGRIGNPPYSRLYYVTDGGGKITLEDSVVELEKNKIYLFPTGKSIYNFYSEDMEQLYFHINMFDFEVYDILRECNVCCAEPDSAQHFEHVISLYKSNDITDHLELKQIIMSQGLDFMKQSNCSIRTKNYSPVVREAVSRIRKSPSMQINIQRLADELFISKCALNNRFRKEIGKSVGQFIDDTVMGEARYILAIEETPISKVSERLGFCDQSYFSACFRKRYGFYPSEYRKKQK